MQNPSTHNCVMGCLMERNQIRCLYSCLHVWGVLSSMPCRHKTSGFKGRKDHQRLFWMSDVYACTQFVCIRHAARKRQLICGKVELAHNAQSRLITSLPSTLEYLNIYWLNVNVIHYCDFIWCSSHTWPLTWARICMYVHWKCNQKLCQWTWEC